MSTNIHRQVEAARAGTKPSLICRVESGWAVLADMQYLRGYCILLPDPVVGSLNDLSRPMRAAFLCDMVMIGDALLEVTDAYRINYGIMGNSDPALHAHIVPRYSTEPEKIRRHLPWSYPQEYMDSKPFDRERDEELIQQLVKSIQIRQ
jgi:diadenosine tetraphosphate (Ap4A) HIT family hydrolase